MADDATGKNVEAGLAELQKGLLSHSDAVDFYGYLLGSWRWPLEAVDEDLGKFASLDEEAPRLRDEYPARPATAKRPPPWYVGMSSSFSKETTGIDRKLQGRILEAIMDITQNPMTLRGDTLKPLTGALQGCWRYRVGDYRLIYSPDKTTGNVTLLTFASRGSAYAD